MQFRQLGQSGLEVSLVGLGSNNFGPPKILWRLADVTLCRKLRQRLGVPLCEAYGQTETGITVWTPDEDVRLGAIGTVLPGVEFRLSDEGEILSRRRAGTSLASTSRIRRCVWRSSMG